MLKELHAYFKKYYDKDLAAEFRDYLVRTCAIVLSSDVKSELAKYRKLIKQKDLEQLTVVKKLGIKYLVAFDRDFTLVDEYITPKAFVQKFGLKPAASAY